MTDETRQARHSVWWHRGRRFTSAVNVTVALLLALAVVAMVNHLAARYYLHGDISSQGFYRLSDKTRGLLSSLEGDVRAVSFFRQGHELHDHMRSLLKEYAYAAEHVPSLRFEMELVDPDRDLARTQELAREFDVSEANVVVFESGGRKKYITVRDMVDYDVDFRRLMSTGQAVKRRVGFRGEQAFSSAIQSVMQARSPKVYFLTGHGERDITDYSKTAGYSQLARIMRRDNMELEVLLLAQHRAVPEDASALVVAGADRQLSREEINAVAQYLDRNGRLMLLVDPTVTTGLEPLLKEWGVELANDVVVDPQQTWTGRELCVMEYGPHPVTRRLAKTATMFYLPRSIRPLASVASVDTADRPRVFPLASCSEAGWAEMNLEQSPARFDPDVDQRGPVPVAVAVERGPVSGIEVEIKPTRLVIIGDSDFVCNSALEGGVGGNVDFFMCGMNWLVEREALMAIAPKDSGTLRLDMNRRQMRLVFLALVVVGPAIVALIGVLVWLRRKH